jgi:UDP-N-acetylglucosamine--N-acetylmuramyl-(pentapeptide) pyrophosphoryl-undecaprenol N-acetylglucosamine transferase
LAAADLVVGRSGAGAVSEITAVGRPSLLIPYPYASGDHQRLNAESLERAGAAVCVTNQQATVDRMEAELGRLLGDVSLLVKMARAAQLVGRPHAADVIARDFLRMANVTITPMSAPPTGGEHATHMSYGEVA